MPSAENWTKRAEFAVCTIDSVIVLNWKAPPVLEGVTRCELVAATLRRTRPNAKIGFLTYVAPAAQEGSPPPPVRLALSRFLKENEDRIRASVIIYEGTGFKATIVRSVVTAINLASGLKFPSSVASSRTVGATWLVNQMQGDTVATVSELVGLILEDPRDVGVGVYR